MQIYRKIFLRRKIKIYIIFLKNKIINLFSIFYNFYFLTRKISLDNDDENNDLDANTSLNDSFKARKFVTHKNSNNGITSSNELADDNNNISSNLKACIEK